MTPDIDPPTCRNRLDIFDFAKYLEFYQNNPPCCGTDFGKRKTLRGCGMASAQVCAATPLFSKTSLLG
jgi:hypothetical protein